MSDKVRAEINRLRRDIHNKLNTGRATTTSSNPLPKQYPNKPRHDLDKKVERMINNLNTLSLQPEEDTDSDALEDYESDVLSDAPDEDRIITMVRSIASHLDCLTIRSNLEYEQRIVQLAGTHAHVYALTDGGQTQPLLEHLHKSSLTPVVLPTLLGMTL